MRYRRFGQSDLVVSEVGFGTWTLVTDWWGRTDDPDAMITAALDAGHQLHRHRAGLRERRRRRVDPRSVPARPRRHRAHDQVRLRHHGRAQVPGPVGAPARLAAGVDSRAVRRLAAPARHRPHRPVPAAQPAHRADPRRRPVGRAARPAARRQGPRARRRARSGDRLGRGGPPRDRRSADRVAADRLQRARAGARPHLRRSAPRRSRARSASSHAFRTRPTRCRARPPPTPCSTRRITGRTATATTCSTTSRRPRRCRSCGRRTPAARSGRPRSPRSSPNSAFTCVLPTVLSVDDVARVRGGVGPPAHVRRSTGRSTHAGLATSTTSIAT